MPHMIVEYAEDSMNEEQVINLLKTVHSSVEDSELFESSHIKTRAYPFKHFTLAGEVTPYVHIQARIKSGRDNENKKRLGSAILDGVSKLNIAASVITVEVIDMHRDSYAKYVSQSN